MESLTRRRDFETVRKIAGAKQTLGTDADADMDRGIRFSKGIQTARHDTDTSKKTGDGYMWSTMDAPGRDTAHGSC